MLFRIEALPELLIPPVDEPVLFVIVLLSTSNVPEELFAMPPAKLFGELLPLMVLFEIVMTPLTFHTPPALACGKEDEFPLMVLSVIVTLPEPWLSTPPPS